MLWGGVGPIEGLAVKGVDANDEPITFDLEVIDDFLRVGATVDDEDSLAVGGLHHPVASLFHVCDDTFSAGQKAEEERFHGRAIGFAGDDGGDQGMPHADGLGAGIIASLHPFHPLATPRLAKVAEIQCDRSHGRNTFCVECQQMCFCV